MLRPLVMTGCIAAAAGAAAEPVRLEGAAIRETVAGARLDLDTPLGTTVPVQFTDDGLVSGEAGKLASYLGAARDRGRWWVADDRLCIKWFRWFDAEPRCVSIKLDGERVFWREAGGKSGTATIALRAKPVEKVAEKKPEPPAPPPYALGAEEVAKGPTAKAHVAEAGTAHEESMPEEAPLMRFAAAAALVGASTFATASAVMPDPAKAPRRDAPAAATEPHPPMPTIARRAEARPPAKKVALPARPAVTGAFRVAGVDEDDILNVRSGPAEYYAAVGGIPPEGRGVVIVGPCQKDWCPIRHGRLAGWVNRFYLAQETAGAADTDESSRTERRYP